MPGLGTRLGLERLVGGVRSKILSTESDDLIGYWPLGEVPASQEYLTFNGSSTVVNCGNDASLEDLPSGGDMTIDGWIKINTYQTGIIVAKSASLSSDGWAVYSRATDGIRFRVNYDTSTTNADGSVSLETWTHFAAFYDNSEDKIRIAIGGTWGNLSIANVGAYVSDAGDDFVFGDLATAEFDGDIGWVRISDNDRFNGAAGTNFTGSVPARTTIPTVDANTVGLWPFNEGYGTAAGDLSGNGNTGTITDGDWGAYPAADNAEGTAARDGAYTGVTLGQVQAPFTCPLFDGVNDFVNIQTASLASAFSGAAGTVIGFAKVSGSGVWEDGLTHYVLIIQADTNNRIRLYKDTTNNRIVYQYRADATIENVIKDSVSSTGWIQFAITWDKAGSGNMIAYYNGAAEGSPQAIGGIWAGAINLSVIGSSFTTPTTVWDGYLAHCAIWTKALSAAQILAIYDAAGI